MNLAPEFFDSPHHLSLEVLALNELAAGNAAAAFALADRRCRVLPSPAAHSYLLRAEASHRMGEHAAARSDLELAREISPENLLANRRMLAWADGTQQQNAADALIAFDRDPDTLRAAIAIRRAHGVRTFASVVALEDAIRGWTAWTQDGPVEVSIESAADSTVIRLDADPFHPLRAPGLNAAEIDLRRPRSTEPQTIALRTRESAFLSLRAAANQQAARTPANDRPVDARTSVIVPIYAGYETTVACIESLLAATRDDPRWRIVLVDDATPDAGISRYLDALQAVSSVEILTNSRNCGFVGAVNRAFEHLRNGDVVLLNSDTLVPPGFLERLAAAAHSSPDIGTLMPLSNNGEFTSFPLPNTVNPLGSLDEVIAIDAIAAEVNPGRIVDLPAGFGMCLYIKRSCLDGVGGLSERIRRGYLEDVDFCLRARQIGFRSVCATDVYVGHAGSLSFRDEKKSLVARNFEILESSFPGYVRECSAFVELDPLRAARAAIEEAMPVPPGAVLVVSREGATAAAADQRAQALVSQGCGVLSIRIRQGRRGHEAAVFAPSGAAPQSLRFAIGAIGEPDQLLLAYLRRTAPSRIEFVDPGRIPGAFQNALCGLGIPHDILIADTGLAEAGGIATLSPTRYGADPSVPHVTALPRTDAQAAGRSSPFPAIETGDAGPAFGLFDSPAFPDDGTDAVGDLVAPAPFLASPLPALQWETAGTSGTDIPDGAAWPAPRLAEETASLRASPDPDGDTELLETLLKRLAQLENPLKGSAPQPYDPAAANPQHALHPLIETAEHILAPCRRAEAFVHKFLPAPAAARQHRARIDVADAPPIVSGFEGKRLGVVPIETSAGELRLLREIAGFMRHADPEMEIVVLGATLDDLGLMRFGNVFVSGPIEVAELGCLITQYGLARIVAASQRPLFGHPLIEAVLNCGLPAACMDWPSGAMPGTGGHLEIDPSLPPRDIAATLAAWMNACQPSPV